MHVYLCVCFIVYISFTGSEILHMFNRPFDTYLLILNDTNLGSVQVEQSQGAAMVHVVSTAIHGTET